MISERHFDALPILWNKACKFQATDLKELAKAMREKREIEAATALQAKETAELALHGLAPNEADSTDLAVRKKRSCGGGGGCGCCCCCCCCGCGGGGGCGRKKRQILTILRARRNSLAEDAINGAANDWTGYSGEIISIDCACTIFWRSKKLGNLIYILLFVRVRGQIARAIQVCVPQHLQSYCAWITTCWHLVLVNRWH